MSYDSMNAYEDTLRVVHALIAVLERNGPDREVREAIQKAREELAEIAQDVEDMA